MSVPPGSLVSFHFRKQACTVGGGCAALNHLLSKREWQRCVMPCNLWSSPRIPGDNRQNQCNTDQY